PTSRVSRDASSSGQGSWLHSRRSDTWPSGSRAGEAAGGGSGCRTAGVGSLDTVTFLSVILEERAAGGFSARRTGRRSGFTINPIRSRRTVTPPTIVPAVALRPRQNFRLPRIAAGAGPEACSFRSERYAHTFSSGSI